MIFSILQILILSTNLYASEASFTVRIDHFENRSAKTISGFSGRSWDLNNLIQSAKENGDFQWTRIKKSKSNEFIGNTICARIAQYVFDKEKNQVLVDYRVRLRALKALLVQLNLRKWEMNRAGAVFKIEYPSKCESSLKGYKNF